MKEIKLSKKKNTNKKSKKCNKNKIKEGFNKKTKKKKIGNIVGGGTLIDDKDWKTRFIDNIKILKDSDNLQDQIPINKPPYPDCTIL